VKHPIGNGRRSIWLSEEDIALMELMWDFKILSLYQIEYYGERLYGMKRNSIRKKLTRWLEKDIVANKTYAKKPNAKVYYRLGPTGVEILQKRGQIRQQDSTFDEIPNLRHFDHLFGVRDAALLSMINLKKNYIEVTSFAPSKIPYFEKGMEGTSPIVVPDWVLVNQCGFLNIEVDTGTERLSKISEKINKYVKLAYDRPSEIYHVLLAALDESDPDLKYLGDIPKDRNVRIANLKETIINLNAHIYPNLHFYVAPLSRTGEVVYRVMTGKYAAKEHSLDITAIINLLKLNDSVKFEIEPAPSEDFYLAEVKEDLYADGHFLFRNVENKETENVLMTLMEEGGAKSLDKIGYLDLLKSENRFKKKVDKILAVYRSDEELHSDVLGKVFPNVLFTSLDLLKRDLDNPPIFYQTVNGTRKEEVVLYEG
jgi:hypothetical protein